jgi:hypothetical protein
LQGECQVTPREDEKVTPATKLRSLAERRLPDPDLPRMSEEMESLRARFLGAVEHLSISEALAMLKSRLATEKKEMMRLGNLAAQTWLVRQRLVAVRKGAAPASVRDILSGGLRKSPKAGSDAAPGAEDDATLADRGTASWVRVRIIQETEVNGMRFFGGTSIDVKDSDAQRLIDAGTAEMVVEPAAEGTSASEAPPPPAAPAGRSRAKAKS